MKEDEAYIDIAERYLESCEKHIAHRIDIQEAIGFKGYHVFESTAGAYNSHFGHLVPKGHAKKLNAFVTYSNHHGHVNPHTVAAIAMILNAARNKFLYPEQNGTTFKLPKDQISIADAKKLVSKVKGVYQKVKAII